MSKQPGTQEPDEARLEAELIERIYNVAIRPHSYEDFMDKWGDYVRQSLDELSALEREVETGNQSQIEGLSRHFNMGFRLLEELGRTDPSGQKDTAGTPPGAASFLLDRNAHIVWYNSAASRYFGLRRASRIDDLSLWDRSRSELDRMVRGLTQFKDATQGLTNGRTVLRLDAKPIGKTLFMLAEYMPNSDEDPLIIINQVMSCWHDSVGHMLAASFGLSGAEVQIAECLVDGADIAEIAARRTSSINTVRTQIKTLLSKTGLKSRTELVRFLVSLNGVAENAGAAQPHVKLGQTSRFRQREGRTMPYHRFGPDNGRPFIVFHGMLNGCDMAAATVDLLHANDITLYVPERPFFGSATGGECGIEAGPEHLAHDIEDLLDHLGLQTAGLLGHMAGSIYAFAAAAHLGERANAIVSVSGGVPIVSSEQFAAMSTRQRLLAYTARYTPKLLPFVLRAGIRQLDFGGEEKFMHTLFESAPADLETIGDGETARIIASGYHYSVLQGHKAFEIDSYHMVRDWSPRVVQSQVPILLIHGRNDPVVSVRSVEDFANKLGQRARLIIDEESGQLLFYRNPQAVISALAALH